MKVLKTSIASLLAFSAFVNAGSGKAIVPHWGDASSNGPSTVFVSNITDNYINVSIKFYNKDGTVLSPSSYTNFTASNTQLEPGKTGYVNITTPETDYGYATIEWSNVEGDDDTVALVSYGYRQIIETSRRLGMAIQVNDGKPF